MTSTDFSKMVPGFDFLQNLMKGTSSALPTVGQWVAPTLDPAELDKRINELRTVQFWLEQNAKLLGGTIQALEVQRMTLSTLKSMNLPVADFSEAFKLKVPPAAAPAAQPEPEPAAASPSRRKPKASSAGAAPAAGLVDPMQWWGALTQQFTEIASKAIKDSGAEGAREAATTMGRQAAEAAQEAFKAATAVPAQAAKQAVKMAQAAGGRTRKSAASRKR